MKIEINSIKRLLVCCTGIFSMYAVAQDISKEWSPPAANQNYPITSVSKADNIIVQTLPPDFEYNAVRCILKDYMGFMWFGTSDGLVRYDGINLYLYENESGSETSLSHTIVNALAEDVNHNLWIGTNNGLNLYNRDQDNFTRSDTSNNGFDYAGLGFISYLCTDITGQLLIGRYTGLSILRYKDKSFNTYSNIPGDTTSLSSDRVTCIITDTNNSVWAGTQEGLNLLLEGNMGIRRFYPETGNPASIGSENITSLALDAHGDVWVGARGGGLNKIIRQGKTIQFQHFTTGNVAGRLSNNFILSLTADKKGNLWIGTENGGLNRLNISTGIISIYQVQAGEPYSLTSNSIWSLYADNEERIWIGTPSQGINVVDDKFRKFDLYQKNPLNPLSLPDNDVTGFAEDSKGYLWIATDGGGLCKFDPVREQYLLVINNSAGNSGLVNNAIQSILCDSHDNIWVGTWAGGIDKLNSSGRKIRNYTLETVDGSGNNNIFSLFEDSRGNIWSGTAGSGLFRYNPKTDRFDIVASSNTSNVITTVAYVSSFFEDLDSTLWIGTLNGLCKISIQPGGEIATHDFFRGTDNHSINSNMIDVIFQDSRKRLWFGTADEGLNLYNRIEKTFKVFNKSQGLPSNSIKGMLEDDTGRLWILTNKGMCRFFPDSLEITTYTTEDGLNSNQFYVRSCLKSARGEFFIGGENGFNAFFPGEIRNNPYIPAICLTDFKINNKSAGIGVKNSPLKKHIGETTEIRLNYRQSSFTIDFVALNYTRTSRNQYCYMLEGFDNEWNCVGNQRSAIYTNIGPGRYVFKVKGSNNDGLWNETPAELRILIMQPVWAMWWAKLIYIAIFSFAIYFLIRIRNERITINNKLEIEHLAREKEHELNELNIQFFTNISHEFRTPLSLIIAPLENLISSARMRDKEHLTVIYRNAGRLLHLTNNLLDIRKLEEGNTSLRVGNGDIVKSVSDVAAYFKENAKQRSIDFGIHHNEASIDCWFDAEKLETMLMNLLANAFKYTPDKGRIWVAINSMQRSDIETRYEKLIEKARRSGRFIEISVSDNGIGVHPEELPFIFDKFYHSRSTVHKSSSGTGIGLTLTKGLAELHGGFIHVFSLPKTETCFTLVLPVDREVYADTEIDTLSREVLNGTIISDNREYVPNPDRKAQADSGAKNDIPEVLIVEDNDELRNFLAKILSEEYTVTQANNGKTGIDLALKNTPDLIVSDILMPECSGIELCKTLKTDIRSSHIPIILLTAKTTVRDQIEGVETGADAYLTKPFNIRLLFSQINQLIALRRNLYARFSQDVYLLPNNLTSNEIDQQFLQRAIDYILLHLAESELNVERLAEAMNLSRSNVYRKIKALTGKPVVDFIRIVRLKQAIKLMELRKHTLAEIAYNTGFTSPAYFTKIFKDQYGKPPSEFLK